MMIVFIRKVLVLPRIFLKFSYSLLLYFLRPLVSSSCSLICRSLNFCCYVLKAIFVPVLFYEFFSVLRFSLLFLRQEEPERVTRQAVNVIECVHGQCCDPDPHLFGCLEPVSRSMEIDQNVEIKLVFCISERILYLRFLTYYLIFFM
jgi:hypothetical protein